MKLIIDIPDGEYKTLSKMSEKEKVNELSYYERVIANGIPLPEGHDNLMDIDAILMIKRGKTIIEANKEHNNEINN